jgi:hypothetical protein
MARKPKPPHYDADDVRGAEIDLRRPWERIVFIAGLVLVVLAALVMGFAH